MKQIRVLFDRPKNDPPSIFVHGGHIEDYRRMRQLIDKLKPCVEWTFSGTSGRLHLVSLTEAQGMALMIYVFDGYRMIDGLGITLNMDNLDLGILEELEDTDVIISRAEYECLKAIVDRLSSQVSPDKGSEA